MEHLSVFVDDFGHAAGRSKISVKLIELLIQPSHKRVIEDDGDWRVA